ncbi:MAG: methyltransferase domain-containing protein [Gemmatimonas sp.]
MVDSIKDFYERKYTEGTEIARSSKRFTLECVPDVGALDILDVGCGSGENSAVLAAKGHRPVGIDISEEAIRRYRARGFDGFTMDLERGLDFPDCRFDLVFCSEVIEHMMFPEKLASEMARVLKPGGRLVLSTPNSAFWLYRLLAVLGYTVSELQHPKHVQFFSLRSLRAVLRQGGFDIKESFGRNMYVIVCDMRPPFDAVLRGLGFQKETRFRTKGSFWHLSHRSRFWNALFADTLICVATRPASSGGH